MTTTADIPQTAPYIIDVPKGQYDLVDPFNRIFWVDMDREESLRCLVTFGPLYRLVPTTGLPHGSKVSGV